MSASAQTIDLQDAVNKSQFQTPAPVRVIGLALVVVGLALLGIGISSDPTRGWGAALMGSYYVLSIAAGAGVIIALMHVTKAGWGVVVRRIPEAVTTYLPLGLLTLGTVTGLGMQHLYEWSHPDAAEDEVLVRKLAYLNVPGFFTRMVVILGAWIILTLLMRKTSIDQDKDGDEKKTARNVVLGVFYLIAFGLGMTFGSIDWLMSLEPHWFSTMFGVYQFAGAHVAAAATCTIIVVKLRANGQLPLVTENHLHDFGKMMFAFSVFWGYIFVSQYLLIWYSNIPEETGYFLLRWSHGWQPLWALNIVMNFLVPFVCLIPRPNKRNPKWLLPVAIVILLGHFLDVYLQVAPALGDMVAAEHHAEIAGPVFGLTEIGGAATFIGLFVLAVTMALGKASLLPAKDPYLQESIHHAQ